MATDGECEETDGFFLPTRFTREDCYDVVGEGEGIRSAELVCETNVG